MCVCVCVRVRVCLRMFDSLSDWRACVCDGTAARNPRKPRPTRRLSAESPREGSLDSTSLGQILYSVQTDPVISAFVVTQAFKVDFLPALQDWHRFLALAARAAAVERD